MAALDRNMNSNGTWNDGEDPNVMSDGEDDSKKRTKKSVRFITPSLEKLNKLDGSKPPKIPIMLDIGESTDNGNYGNEASQNQASTANGYLGNPPAPPLPNLLSFEAVEAMQTDSGINSPHASPSRATTVARQQGTVDTGAQFNDGKDMAERMEGFHISYSEEHYKAMQEALKKRLSQPIETYPELKME
uniref:Uncharacterized protein LOC102809640 n=1 Tax=Saccoglossus kowalevskii TaxID=10224 RepID=A0ABM0M9Z2_SACKO|nr:PREDICTED: uncharacterized protein LOC102809640 [Saccoglossus kowalevskii]